MDIQDETSPQDQFHFYASSIADWRTTNETRDLRALLKIMDKFGYDYNLFFVPLPPASSYKIKRYAPEVEGAIWLGGFEVKGKK
jgi:hypothetical protein